MNDELGILIEQAFGTPEGRAELQQLAEAAELARAVTAEADTTHPCHGCDGLGLVAQEEQADFYVDCELCSRTGKLPLTL